jgi:hypothetical protein
MLRRHYGVTHTSITSFTVRINKIPLATTKRPFNLTTKYLSSDLKATGMLLISLPPIRLAVLHPNYWRESPEKSVAMIIRVKTLPKKVSFPRNSRTIDYDLTRPGHLGSFQ